jgi:O-antigen/teichoic acid export membrane protein
MASMSGWLSLLHQLEARRFISAFSSRFSSAVLSFFVLLSLSRLLPTHEYGLYVFLFSIGSALGLIAVLGQQILVVKHYRRTAAAGDRGNQSLLRVNFLWLAFGFCLLLVAALIFWIIGPELPPPYHYLWVACLFAAIYGLSEYLQNYFRIHGRINLSLMPREIIWRIGSVAGVGLAAAIGDLRDGVTAMLIVTILLLIVTLYQVIQFLRTEGLSWLTRPTAEFVALTKVWQEESLYFTANNSLNSCSSYLETIVIGALLGVDKAGFYFVALRIAMLLTLPVAAIDTVGIPMIAARFQKADRAGAQRLIGRLSFASFLISSLGALALTALAPIVLHFFNKDFVQHTDVLFVLCVLAVSQAFFGPGSWLLMIGGGERFFLFARAALFTLYLGLLYGFGHLAGMFGIASAGVLFSTASNIVAARWIMQKWGIDNMATSIIRPFLFGGQAKLDPAHGASASEEAAPRAGSKPLPLYR